MTLEDWLAALAPSHLHDHFAGLRDRKVHLLTAAFLRRVWDDLPSHRTRTAVEATEQFADGRISLDELARLRSTDLLESGELLWVDPLKSQREEQLVGAGDYDWWDGPCWDGDTADLEFRATTTGKGLEGVRSGVKKPAWVAAQAAFLARDLVRCGVDPEDRDPAERAEAAAQLDLFREIVGPRADPRWLQWRTDAVRGVARAIHRDLAFHDLPILADALQDAGCDDEVALNHCREPGQHVRGCWVVDLAMGVE